MPQSERSNIFKELLEWLRDVFREATLRQMVAYIVYEITELGATKNTARKYVETLRNAHFIEEIKDTRRFRITEAGKRWLERHSI